MTATDDFMKRLEIAAARNDPVELAALRLLTFDMRHYILLLLLDRNHYWRMS
jgi:hypothetical protein